MQVKSLMILCMSVVLFAGSVVAGNVAAPKLNPCELLKVVS